MRLPKHIIIIFLCSFLILSCSVSDEELKVGRWKYRSGQHIGDFLTFDDSTISNDTIYENDIAIGIIVDREESIFGLSSRKIFIRPLINSSNPHEDTKNENNPNNKEKYSTPYPKDLGVYCQKG